MVRKTIQKVPPFLFYRCSRTIGFRPLFERFSTEPPDAGIISDHSSQVIVFSTEFHDQIQFADIFRKRPAEKTSVKLVFVLFDDHFPFCIYCPHIEDCILRIQQRQFGSSPQRPIVYFI
ncbi:MAG TPA: hypothetical protein DDX57_03115 [Bacteroidales bacterium]|nr:hypothetical protein [Bacteroidales bacterium]